MGVELFAIANSLRCITRTWAFDPKVLFPVIGVRVTRMELQGEGVIFSNFIYNPDCYYFLYIGDLKAYTLNAFVSETLQWRIPGKEIRFVAIVPDVCLQYNYANIIVINPEASADMIANQNFAGDGKKPIMSCRISSKEFMTAVSDSPSVHKLIEKILDNQNQLYINMYESVVEMTLDHIDRVSILGPDKYIAKHWNNKIVQYKELQGIVPLIEGEVCKDRETLYKRSVQLRQKYSDGIFVSAAYSAAGANSAVTYSHEEVQSKFHEEGEYLITRYLPHILDPTVLAVVANENDVYIAGIADQHIIDGNKFVGSSFPSKVTEEQAQEMKEYTVTVGRVLGRGGYRGIFGCDYLIDDNDQIFFLEINARKQGTTLEFCFTLEQNLPEGAPMLPELEYFAVIENRFPPQTVEMTQNIRGIHWGTYNHKVMDERITTGYIPQNPYEREAFRKVARKELVKDFAILEHLGTNLKVMPGTFLARVVSVARSHEDVNEGLCQGVGFINQTIQEV